MHKLNAMPVEYSLSLLPCGFVPPVSLTHPYTHSLSQSVRSVVPLFDLLSFTLIFILSLAVYTSFQRHQHRYQKVNIFTVKRFKNEDSKKKHRRSWRSGKHAAQSCKIRAQAHTHTQMYQVLLEREKEMATEDEKSVNKAKTTERTSVVHAIWCYSCFVSLYASAFHLLQLTQRIALSPGQTNEFLSPFSLIDVCKFLMQIR